MEAWSQAEGVPFVWEADLRIDPRWGVGGWRARLGPPEAEDWIDVQPIAAGGTPQVVLRLVAGAGHAEVYVLDLAMLGARLAGARAFFGGWASFFSGGPGRGH